MRPLLSPVPRTNPPLDFFLFSVDVLLSLRFRWAWVCCFFRSNMRSTMRMGRYYYYLYIVLLSRLVSSVCSVLLRVRLSPRLVSLLSNSPNIRIHLIPPYPTSFLLSYIESTNANCTLTFSLFASFPKCSKNKTSSINSLLDPLALDSRLLSRALDRPTDRSKTNSTKTNN